MGTTARVGCVLTGCAALALGVHLGLGAVRMIRDPGRWADEFKMTRSRLSAKSFLQLAAGVLLVYAAALLGLAGIRG